jgi:hypothetical protein
MLQKQTKNKKTQRKCNWHEILYIDIQEIHLIINYIMLSIKWSQ